MKKDIYNKCTLHMHTCANIAVHRRPWTDLTNVKVPACISCITFFKMTWRLKFWQSLLKKRKVSYSGVIHAKCNRYENQRLMNIQSWNDEKSFVHQNVTLNTFNNNTDNSQHYNHSCLPLSKVKITNPLHVWGKKTSCFSLSGTIALLSKITNKIKV